ncbi:MAG: hypothetical protein ACFB9M_15830 [Myxococcota bacterium]
MQNDGTRVRQDLQAAARAARHLAETLRGIEDILAEIRPGKRADLHHFLLLMQKNLRDALNHAALMVAYAQGPTARTAYFARTVDQLPEPEEHLERLPAVMATVTDLVAETLEHVAAFPTFGPAPKAPTKPGPQYTARYARAHLESLARRIPTTTSEALDSDAHRNWLRRRAQLGFGIGTGLA